MKQEAKGESMQTSHKVLMCYPEFYGIKFGINDWQKKSLERARGKDPVNNEFARNQWCDLYDVLKTRRFDIAEGTPDIDLLDMVFTSEAGLVFGERRDEVILGRFRYQKERGGEEAHFRRFFEQHKYIVHELPEGCVFEGNGDALWFGNTLVCGYGFRSNVKGLRAVSRLVGCDCVFLRLVDSRFYHLNMCFCPLGDYFLFYPGAFDEESRWQLEPLGDAVPISRSDALRFIANGIRVEDPLNPWWQELITNSPPTMGLWRELARRSTTVTIVNLSEFRRSGGGARCLICLLN